MRRSAILPALLFASLGLAAIPPREVALERALAHYLPSRTVAVVELPGAHELFAAGLRHPFAQAVLASPLGDVIRERAKMPPALALGALNLWASRPVLPALAAMTQGGLALAVVPRAGGRALAVAARGDATTWREVIELVLTRVATERGLPLDKVVPPHRRVRGMDVWSLGGAGAMAHADGLFLASDDASLLSEMLEAGASEVAGGLGAEPRFRAAETAVDGVAFARAWVDLEAARAAGARLEGLDRMAEQPASHLLLGSTLARLAASPRIAARLTAEGNELALSLTGLDAPGDAPARALVPSSAPAPALPEAAAEETGRALVYRDLAGLFAHRVELFAPEVQPRFAEATSNLALFFEGADVTDEVLPGLDPWIGLVVRDVAFDEGAVPDVPLPGAAAVVRLRDAELAPRLVTAFQVALAVSNVEAAQQRRPALTLGLEQDEGRTISLGRYRAPAPGEGVDVRYNLVPACTVVGDRFVLGTHVSLVRDVARELAAERLASVSDAAEHLSLSGASIARLLESNRDALVMGAVLDDGKSEEQAADDLRGLVRLARALEHVEARASVAPDGAATLDLRAALGAGGSR